MLPKRRQHRRTGSYLAEQRRAHKELLSSHITPLTPLSNRQLAGQFAINHIRRFNQQRRYYYYSEKQSKEKTIVSDKILVDGKNNTQKPKITNETKSESVESANNTNKDQAAKTCAVYKNVTA